GQATPLAARYPMPAWAPAGGWRVDRALCLAHALQESQFRIEAVSRAGARGLMQLMPATARLVARHKGDAPEIADRLSDPAVSFEYGQSYLQELADNGGTGGLLPKVIAAYNAGPNNVAAWSARPGASADPLFFIETIPFAETRGYVATVLRNYWMYQRETGVPSESLAMLAQGKWPRFPVMPAQRRTAQAEPAPIASALSN
ncbi:lytic transglycosylase domain-containing protein, partial [Sphingomonas bacterium]|uniref:lytic transglycosylase domain-containing protein n=1 Tax=Sphingomonas bacterium TaxID=1895847 RepID=UPI001575751A